MFNGPKFQSSACLPAFFGREHRVRSLQLSFAKPVFSQLQHSTSPENNSFRIVSRSHYPQMPPHRVQEVQMEVNPLHQKVSSCSQGTKITIELPRTYTGLAVSVVPGHDPSAFGAGLAPTRLNLLLFFTVPVHKSINTYRNKEKNTKPCK